MEDLFKSFADELEERKLTKGYKEDQAKHWKEQRSRGAEIKANIKNKGQANPAYPVSTGTKSPGVGHGKDVKTKRKELVDDITQYDMSTGHAPEGITEKDVREMHEYNHSDANMSDKDIHKEHRYQFPKQYD